MKWINIIVVISVFFIGYFSNNKSIPIEEKTHTVFDTITIIKDSIRIDTVYNIEYKKEYLTKVINTTDTVTIKDTVLVYVPINKYLFEEPNLYKIEASGYNVVLDKIEVYPKTVHVNTVHTIKEAPKFGIGIQLGYGICGDRISPYIGIGAQYNLISF